MRILQSMYPHKARLFATMCWFLRPLGWQAVTRWTGAWVLRRVRTACSRRLVPRVFTKRRRAGFAAYRHHIRSIFAAHSRMEWHPLETIALSDCAAENRLTLPPANGAETTGWDITALALPATNKHFDAGVFCQHFELPGVWLKRAIIQASDQLLLDNPGGLAGQRCFATLFFVSGTSLGKARRQGFLDAAPPRVWST